MLLVVQIKQVFFPNVSKAIYGDRLDGIEKVKITKSEQNKIKDSLKENANVEKVNIVISGKIFNVLITVKNETSLDDAKGLGATVLTNLEDKQKKFYDVQVFVQKTNDSKQFPIIGYKHHTKDDFTWTKDRAES